MKKLSIALLLIVLFSCSSKSEKKSSDSIKSAEIRDSINRKKSVDSAMRAVASADSDTTPTQAEERERLSKTYDDVKITDSLFISDNDTLHFRLKYYCLKNIDLIIPKFYEDAKDPKDFLTHPFVTDILLINNGDTVLNKQFKASDFYPFFTDNFGGALKKYASIIDPELSRRNKDTNYIEVDYSISIPSTDLGIGMSLTIDKNGAYKMAGNH